jgi:hypothetical protein
MADLVERPIPDDRQDAGYDSLRPSGGWYPDPDGLTLKRWWDGTQWTLARRTYWRPGADSSVYPKKNRVAIAAAICSLAGFLTFGVSAVVGVVLGFRAYAQIRETGGAQPGDDAAILGIVLGFLCIAFFIAAVLTNGFGGGV